MTKNPDLQKLLDQNPRAKAEADKIERAQEVLRTLRENGVPPRAYDLEPPFGRRSWLRQATTADPARKSDRGPPAARKGRTPSAA
jgi:hypothetical protein